MRALAKIHVAKKQLGLDDDTYRAVLVRVGGQASAKGMSEAQLGRVLEEFKRLGFKPALPFSGKPLAGARTAVKVASKGRRRDLDGKYAPKLRALWIAGWNLGVIRDNSDAAMLSFVKGQTGLDHTRFLHHHQDAESAIEGLKGWLARETGIKWHIHYGSKWFAKSGGKIAAAQWRMLEGGETLPPDGGFAGEVWRILGRDGYPMLDDLAERDWHPVMKEFGKRIRAAKMGD